MQADQQWPLQSLHAKTVIALLKTRWPDKLYRKLDELWNVILDKAAQEALG